MIVKDTLRRFDKFLEQRGLKLSAVLVGGAALGLLGVIDRQTRDCDVLCPDLTTAVLDSAIEFAKAQRQLGTPLDDEWLNNGPSSLVKQLPLGWDTRLRQVFSGSSISLSTLGHTDLLLSKLFALCDRGTDLPDCLALKPTLDDLKESLPWLVEQDANELWPQHVRDTIDDLSERLFGHGLSS